MTSAVSLPSDSSRAALLLTLGCQSCVEKVARTALGEAPDATAELATGRYETIE